MIIKKGAVYIHKLHKWKTKVKKITKTHVAFEYNGGVVWTPIHSFKDSFKKDVQPTNKRIKLKFHRESLFERIFNYFFEWDDS